ncbi:MAG: sensor histidine kinase [Lachnospiraceae bacterium]
MAEKYIQKISSILSMTISLVVLLYLIALGVMDNIKREEMREDDNISRIVDYHYRVIGSKEAPTGTISEYRFTVDEELQKDSHLGFYVVHQYVDVFLDGEKIYSLHPSDNDGTGKTVGSNWVMIPLYREDVGKEIRVECTSVYKTFVQKEITFYIGSPLSIFTNRLVKDLPQLIVSAMAVFVGIMFLWIAFIRNFKKRKQGEKFLENVGHNLACLGLFSIMIGLWRLTDTRFTPFVLPEKPIFLYTVSVTMMMVGIIPLMRSIRGNTAGSSVDSKEGIMIDIFCILASLTALVQILLQVCGIMDLRETLFLTHCLILLGVVIIILNNIINRIHHPEKYRKHPGKNLSLIFVVGVIIDVVVFYIRRTSSGLLFSLLAFILYVIILGIMLLFQYGEQETQLAEKNRQLAENERLLAENTRQLTESRIATMISQIQPHFIYNTLGTIEQFCLEDPEKASSLVHEFSLYLRGNFVELDNVMPIRISQEMEHVRHYVGIEQIRFPDMQVKYDLQAGEFFVPALTVQPLVENAIKHGLMGLEEGGTIVISTYETGKNYVICVEDDGVGFDKSALTDGKSHVGLKNIRGRVEAICGGSLHIDSTLGKGTKAEILIPKEEEK